MKVLNGFLLIHLTSFVAMTSIADTEVDPTQSKKLMVKQIKSNIVQIAEANIGEADPDGAIQAQLEQLVSRLITVSPQKSVEDRAPLIVGPWRQLYGPWDFAADRPSNSNADPMHVYQIVFEDGFYYNIGQNNYLGANLISALRGTYELKDDGLLHVQFTDVRFRWGSLTSPQDYVGLPELIENKELRSFRLKNFFAGPIFKITGTLREVYTDQNMRILYGSTSDGTFDDYLYIME